MSESIAGRIERAQGRPPNESQLKMAMIPDGASLIDAGDLWFPVVVVENVYVFPGVPELLDQEVRLGARALPRRAVPAEERLREAARERDRRVAERPAARVPGAPARLLPEDRRGGLPRAPHARVARRRLPRPRARLAAQRASPPTRSTRSSSWTATGLDPAAFWLALRPPGVDARRARRSARAALRSGLRCAAPALRGAPPRARRARRATSASRRPRSSLVWSRLRAGRALGGLPARLRRPSARSTAGSRSPRRCSSPRPRWLGRTPRARRPRARELHAAPGARRPRSPPPPPSGPASCCCRRAGTGFN